MLFPRPLGSQIVVGAMSKRSLQMQSINSAYLNVFRKLNSVYGQKWMLIKCALNLEQAKSYLGAPGKKDLAIVEVLQEVLRMEENVYLTLRYLFEWCDQLYACINFAEVSSILKDAKQKISGSLYEGAFIVTLAFTAIYQQRDMGDLKQSEYEKLAEDISREYIEVYFKDEVKNDIKGTIDLILWRSFRCIGKSVHADFKDFHSAICLHMAKSLSQSSAYAKKVYSDTVQTLIQELQDENYKVKHFETPVDSVVAVLDRDEFPVIKIFFRGTNMTFIQEILMDFAAIPIRVKFGEDVYFFHGGFFRFWKLSFKEIEDFIRESLINANIKKARFELIGHSLGAGLASISALYLASFQLQYAPMLYTFGNPGAIFPHEPADSRVREFNINQVGDLISGVGTTYMHTVNQRPCQLKQDAQYPGYHSIDTIATRLQHIKQNIKQIEDSIDHTAIEQFNRDRPGAKSFKYALTLLIVLAIFHRFSILAYNMLLSRFKENISFGYARGIVRILDRCMLRAFIAM